MNTIVKYIAAIIAFGFMTIQGVAQSGGVVQSVFVSFSGSGFASNALTASGNFQFSVNCQNGTDALGVGAFIPAGKLRIQISVPAEVVFDVSNITTIGPSGSNYWTFVPQSTHYGYFYNALDIPTPSPQGIFGFTMPYTVSGPFSAPAGGLNNYLVQFSSTGGELYNTNTNPIANKIIGVVSANLTSLPVIFNHFTATSKSCEAQLEWSVAKELGAEVYHIERSSDGKEFATIAKVNYNSEAKGNYVFSDKEVLKGNNIYRIKAVDPDGTSLLSDVQRLTFDCDQTNILMYPNPTASGVTISGLASGQRITLYDLTGRMLINKKVNNAEEQLDLSNYAAAMYKVVITTAEGTVIYSNKLAKQ